MFVGTLCTLSIFIYLKLFLENVWHFYTVKSPNDAHRKYNFQSIFQAQYNQSSSPIFHKNCSFKIIYVFYSYSGSYKVSKIFVVAIFVCGNTALVCYVLSFLWSISSLTMKINKQKQTNKQAKTANDKWMQKCLDTFQSSKFNATIIISF